MSGYLPPPPPVSPFRTSFPFEGEVPESKSSQSETQTHNWRISNPLIMPSSELTAIVVTPVNTWDDSKVKEWLDSLKCGSYSRNFKENHITGDVLLECDLNTLKQLGIRKVGDRIRIHQSIKSLRKKSSSKEESGTHVHGLGIGPSASTVVMSPGGSRKTLQDITFETVSPFASTSRNGSPINRPSTGPSTATILSYSRAGSGLQTKSHQDAVMTPGVTASTPLAQTIMTTNNVTTHNNVSNSLMSMDIVKQNSVKFIYTQGQSKTVNISNCISSNEIKIKALKKNLHDDSNPEGWTVHVADNELGTTTRMLSDKELVEISQNSNRLERKRLMLCPSGSKPTLKQLSKSQQILRDSLVSEPSTVDVASVGNVDKTRSTRKEIEVDEDEEDETETIFPDRLKTRKLGRLSEQRPPSELISSNLAHYFPAAESGELEETVRNSIRFSRRISRMSQRMSQRISVSSSVWGIPENEEIPPVPPVPFVDDTMGNYSNTTIRAESQDISTFQEDKNMTQKLSILDEAIISDANLSKLSNHISSNHISSQSEEARPVVEIPGSESEKSNVSVDSQKDSSARSSIRKSVIPRPRKSIISEVSIISKMANRLSSISVAHSSIMGVKEEVDEGLEKFEEEDSEDSEFWRTLRQEERCPRKWIKGRLIGSGSYATVCLGMNPFTGELMAVKQVELTADYKSNERKKRVVDAWLQEMILLRELHHENIVQYLGAKSEDDLLNIFLEYVPGGSVAMLLANYGVFEEDLVRNFVRQILNGLKYLHDKNIVHRDIKGANVLVDNKGCIRITDFGISKKIEAELLTTKRESLKGSVYWMAPEVVKHSLYTFKGDIWSVGCLIVEMFSGTHPFPEFTQMQAVFRIGNSGIPAIPPNCSEVAKDLLKKAFALDYKERPTAGELLEHDFLKQPKV